MGAENLKIVVIAAAIIIGELIIGLTKASYTVSIKIGKLQVDIKKEVVS
ncbi:hypothetical protein [Caldicellulosiruptor morganii]|uniref:Uncharacterized protein n=1 Tax=Caldicellulosiruptor morganii TaxID=1387555 RepID=A0ABY7BKC1_9FIRM|nr:hypothetical protein [Caldicellulosiruptor morganii]WAM33288.1 hypothetical protein OTK00_001783 [Caldicellulosiruptor morganii]